MIDAAGSLDSVAHVIQTALTPVFMLSGIGTLLNLFNTRLARVSDHLESANDLLGDELDAASRVRLLRHLSRLHRRTYLGWSLTASMASPRFNPAQPRPSLPYQAWAQTLRVSWSAFPLPAQPQMEARAGRSSMLSMQVLGVS